MAEQEKKGKSRGPRIPRYFRKRNLLNEYYRCSKCGRGGKFYYVYYEEKSPNWIYCGNCFAEIKKKIEKGQYKPPAKKKTVNYKAAINKKKPQEEKKEKKIPKTNQIEELEFETIPVGATIYYGNPTYHNCQSEKRKIVKNKYYVIQSNNTQSIADLYHCTGCGA